MTTETLERNVTKVGALLRSRVTTQWLTTVIQKDDRLELMLSASDKFDLASLQELAGDVLFIEIDAADPTEIRTLGQFLSDGAAPPVVVTSPIIDVQSMRALMKIG